MKKKCIPSFCRFAAFSYGLAIMFFLGRQSEDSPSRNAITELVSEFRAYKKANGTLPTDLAFVSKESHENIRKFSIRYDPATRRLSSQTQEYYGYSPVYILTFGLFGHRYTWANPGFDLNML